MSIVKPKWIRKPRDVPNEPPSDWQWWWGDDPTDTEPLVMELSPGRMWYPDGWWWTGPLEPRPPAPPKKKPKK